MALQIERGSAEYPMRQRVRPVRGFPAGQMPGGFYVVEVENGVVASWADLFVIRSAPEVLDQSDIIGRTVRDKGGDRRAEAAEAVD